MRYVKRLTATLLIILTLLSMLPFASFAAEEDTADDTVYSETAFDVEPEETETAGEETDSTEAEQVDAAPEEEPQDETDTEEQTAADDADLPAGTEEASSDEEPVFEDEAQETGGAGEEAGEEDEYVLISDNTTEFHYNAPPANSKYVECAGISKARFYADSAWKNIDPANSASKMELVQLETNFAYFFLVYRVRTSNYEWCGPAYSNRWGTYAGKSGSAIANIEIKVYNCTTNSYDNSDYVVMYRAKVAGEWLSWVSNGNEAAMSSIKNDFGLPGSIDYSATDAGWLSRGNITCLQVMMFQRRTRTAGSDAKIIKAPYINQFGAGLPNGCEATSAVMALKYAGVNIDTETFVSKYLPMGAAPSGGVGSDPNKVYVGDPHFSGGLGWGCYAPVIEGAMKKAADQSRYQVINETGKGLSALCSTYINNNVPVIMWATVNMTSSVNYSYWMTPEGKSIQYNNMLHCLLLVGYDSNYYYFNDPMNRVGMNDYFAYPKADVEYAYSLLGKQAVVIRKIVCTGITLRSLPTRTIYYIGETFDRSGLVVNAAYNNGTNKNVTGYTVTGADTSAAGQKTVTVTWSDPLGGSFSKSFTITVVDPTPVLKAIEIVSLPEKTEYDIGEEFDGTGLAVSATYEKNVIAGGKVEKTEGSSEIPIEELTIAGFDSSEEGTCTVTVEFGGFSVSFDVSVKKQFVIVRGDVDGNGDVNMKDVLLCRKIVAGAADDGEIVLENTDLDGDGNVTMKDILILRKILAGAE